ncbi:MAG: AAA family ATPase [Candidatus Omnitrophica bacterium]|nr:AAA family ATPase [Candidatus Omnitrophota bacterium]
MTPPDQAGPGEIRAYQKVMQPMGAMIRTLNREIRGAFEPTRRGGKQGGLIEGDYLDSDSLGAIETKPAAVMAIDLRPREFDVHISFLIDISGSTVGAVLQALAVTAMILREATKRSRGIKTEEYAFSDYPLPLREYDHPYSLAGAADNHHKILSYDHGGTADVAAIEQAVERLRIRRAAFPGLRIYGIGIGPGTEKVKEAYAPYGFQLENFAELPWFVRRILRKELTSAKRPVQNLILVLTDGNPGADNAAAIQKIIHDNKERWAIPPHSRSEVRSLPWTTEKRAFDGGFEDHLVLNKQALVLGPGGPFTPDVEILPIASLLLPKPGGREDSFPAAYVARVRYTQDARRQEALIPLSPYNLKKLEEMMEILSRKVRPNLYLRGPAATGKNTLLSLLAGIAKYPLQLMSLNFDTTERQLVAVQTYGVGGKKKTDYLPSALVQAAQNPLGAFGALDEVNKPATTGVLAALYSLFQHRFIVLPDGQHVVASKKFRAVALGNPDRPPYLVSEIPVDLERRFQFVDFDYLHAPKRDKESAAEVQERLKEAVFFLRLHARQFYADNPEFFEKLVLLAQDIVESFENESLPRPLTVRGLARIVRRLEAYPEDTKDFMTVFGSAYNLSRLTPEQRQALNLLIETHFPGKSVPPTTLPFLKHEVVAKTSGRIQERYYRIMDETGKVLAEHRLPPDGKRTLPIEQVHPSQSVLRAKLELLKAISLGEHILIFGHTGTGKTTIALDLLNNDLFLRPRQQQLNADTKVGDLWGVSAVKGRDGVQPKLSDDIFDLEPEELSQGGGVLQKMTAKILLRFFQFILERLDAQTVWQKSPVMLAMIQKVPIVIDDFGKPEFQAVISVLNNILQFGQIMTPYGLVEAGPGFFVIATTTPEEARYAAHELSGEVEDSFWLAYYGWMTPEEEKAELKRSFPEAPPGVVDRFVEAAVHLREAEEQKGEYVRPIAIEDLKATLERWLKGDRTLYEIFMSVYAIEPTSEYAQNLKTAFEDPRFDLFDERFSRYKPAPSVEEIFQETAKPLQLKLLSERLQINYHGPTGANRFVSEIKPAASFSLRQVGTSPKHEITLPLGMRPLEALKHLKDRPEFSDPEHQEMETLFHRLNTPPVLPPFGVEYIDKALKVILPGPEAYLQDANIDGILTFLRTDPARAPRDPEKLAQMIRLLEWIQAEGLYTDNTRTRAGQILEILKAPRSEARSEVRSLIGFSTGADRTVPPIPTRRVETKVLERALVRLMTIDGEAAALAESVGTAYYAGMMPGLVTVEKKEGSNGSKGTPVYYLDEVLSGISGDAADLLMGLLLTHEIFLYYLREGETRTASLTEELAALAEVDRFLWAKKIPDGERKKLIELARKLDGNNTGEREKLEESLKRLASLIQKPDEDPVWTAFARELQAYPVFKDQKFDLVQFKKLRQKGTQSFFGSVDPAKITEELSRLDAEREEILKRDKLTVTKESETRTGHNGVILSAAFLLDGRVM